VEILVATLTIEKSGPPLFGFQLHTPEGHTINLAFDSSGKAQILLAPGNYVIDFVVRGPFGTPFSFTITLNDHVVSEVDNATISAMQFEAGHLPLTVTT
jgi:hypothetical protein